MKDKLKNTLEHEVELLGRSISILTITGLLLIGGGSAALLTSFGTIDGEANVDQAFQVEGVEGESDLDFTNFDSNQVAGESAVDGPYTVTNNQDTAFEPEVTTTLARDDGSDYTEIASTTGTEDGGYSFDWNYETDSFDDASNGDQVGIDTQYVNAFHEANESGYDPSEYESDHTIDEKSDWTDYLNNGEIDGTSVSNQDVIEVTDASYTISDGDTDDAGVTIDEEVTIYAAERGVDLTVETSKTTNGVYIRSNDATFTGFDIKYSNSDSQRWANAVAIYGKNTEVSHNTVEATDQSVDTAFLVTSDAIGTSSDDGANINNNRVVGSSFHTGVLVSDTGDQQDDGSVEITSSDFTSALDYGVVVSAHEGDTNGQHPMGTTVSSNTFDVSEEAVYVPDDTTFKGTDVPAVDSGEVDATGNFFHEVPDVSNVDTSYEVLSDFEVDPESTEAFGVVNEFDLYLTTTDFQLTSTIGASE